MDILYKNIKQRREALSMSQESLADKVGYTSRSSIAKIENGDVDIPLSKIEAFAKALHCTPSELMGWDDSSIPVSSPTDEDRDLLDKYNALDSRGKSNVKNVLAIEHLRMKNEKYSIGLNIDDIIKAAAYGGKSETKIKPSGKRGESEKAYRDMMNPHTKDNKD